MTVGLEQKEAVFRDLEVAYECEEDFLCKVHEAKNTLRRGEHPKRVVHRKRNTEPSQDVVVPMSGADRVLFSTKDGFTGLGPEGLEPGDVVVVPFGSSRLWVLGNHGGHYIFVGEAVIPGIMSGRLQTLHEDGELDAINCVLP